MCNIDKKKALAPRAAHGRSMGKTAADKQTANLKAKWTLRTFKSDTDAQISVSLTGFIQKKKNKKAELFLLIINCCKNR